MEKHPPDPKCTKAHTPKCKREESCKDKCNTAYTSAGVLHVKS